MIVTETMSGTRRARLVEELLRGEERGLEDERVEDGLEEEDVGPAVEEAADLSAVRGDDFASKTCVRFPGIVHVHGEGERAVRRAERARDEGVPPGRRAVGVHGPPREAGGLDVQLVGEGLEAVVREGDRLRVERVRLDDVRAGVEVLRGGSSRRSRAA